LICCISLPPATILSVPIYDYATAHEELANEATDFFYSCAERLFVQGASTPSVNLETMTSVRFAIPTEEKQMKSG
jgi:hypothetical protein